MPIIAVDDEKKDIDIYEHMAQWRAFIRRHDANVFDVFFFDKEQLSEDDITAVIEKVAGFFQLPVPVIHQQCKTMAEVMMGEEVGKYEMSYNWQMMKSAGINNKDALTMVVVHETTHQLLRHTHFGIFDNEMWIHELIADLMAGAYAALNGNMATGKYKYVLEQQPAKLTHPDGKLRAKAVEFGWQTAWLLLMSKRYYGIKAVVNGLPAFVYTHYSTLHSDWERVCSENE